MYEKSPDRIELGVSRILAVLLIAVHAGAVAIAFWMPLAGYLRGTIAAAIAISCYRALRHHALRAAPRAIVALEWDGANDDCQVRARAGDWRNGRLIDRWVHPWLTLLIVKYDDARWPENLVIAADAVAAEPFRRLRVRLRWRTSGE